uniref:Uncharacterized protein n=1 Tax=Oryza sativa subsp. japonica TaxID=39947 RepID=Q5VMZ6_ORYSJ|nr:hypothetical protein [Oryza sativa Japonica Group]
MGLFSHAANQPAPGGRFLQAPPQAARMEPTDPLARRRQHGLALPSATPLTRLDLEAVPLTRLDPAVGGGDAAGSGGGLESWSRRRWAQEWRRRAQERWRSGGEGTAGSGSGRRACLEGGDGDSADKEGGS